jgi:hypothetical protein
MRGSWKDLVVDERKIISILRKKGVMTYTKFICLSLRFKFRFIQLSICKSLNEVVCN